MAAFQVITEVWGIFELSGRGGNRRHDAEHTFAAFVRPSTISVVG